MRPTSHHPPHIYLDNTWYMITGSIYQRQKLLRPRGYKDFVRDQLRVLVAEFKIQLAAWVILDNHHHILIKSTIGKELSRFIGRWHGRTSFEINGRDDKRGRQVWHNYWDTCMKDEKDYWTHFNYIHHNPVKHGYVEQMQAWEFSSYRYYLEHKGKEWMMDILEHHPIRDFSDPRDDF